MLSESTSLVNRHQLRSGLLAGWPTWGPSPRLLTSGQLDPLVDPTNPDEPMLHGRIRRVDLQGLGDLAPVRPCAGGVHRMV